jgi:WD40 repeat protein
MTNKLLQFGGILLALSLIQGCSSKKHFEVDDSVGTFANPKHPLLFDIKSFNNNSATLTNGTFITKNGVSKITLPKDFTFLNTSKSGEILAANTKNQLMVGTKSNIIDMDNIVVAASKKQNVIAVVYIDNSIALYDMNSSKTVYKEYLSPALSNDTKIANPVFMSNIVLIPTLDGQIKVIDIARAKLVRNIVVDTKKDFKNITFLDVIGEKMIVATKHKLMSVGATNLSIEDYDIRNIIVKDDYIYIATIDGTIVKLDSDLNEIAKRKYKFAKIYALIYTDALFAVESQGYIIKISPDFESDEIYDFSINEDDKVIAIENKLYFQDRYIEIN